MNTAAHDIALLFEQIAAVIVSSGAAGICVCAAAVIAVTVLALCLGWAAAQLFFRFGKNQAVQLARRDAVKRSRAVVGGQVGEQVAPFMPGFPCGAEDVRFIGKPVDFIGFCGLYNAENGGNGAESADAIDEILFIEVKSGGSRLSRREQAIKNAVEHGRVRYVEYRLPDSR